MTDHVTAPGCAELCPEIEALKATVPPRAMVAAGGITLREMSELTPGRSATSPLHEARTAVKITRKKLIAERISRRCARSLGLEKCQNRILTFRLSFRTLHHNCCVQRCVTHIDARISACGEVFLVQVPDRCGPGKFDQRVETAAELSLAALERSGRAV